MHIEDAGIGKGGLQRGLVSFAGLDAGQRRHNRGKVVDDYLDKVRCDRAARVGDAQGDGIIAILGVALRSGRTGGCGAIAESPLVGEEPAVGIARAGRVEEGRPTFIDGLINARLGHGRRVDGKVQQRVGGLTCTIGGPDSNLVRAR